MVRGGESSTKYGWGRQHTLMSRVMGQRVDWRMRWTIDVSGFGGGRVIAVVCAWVCVCVSVSVSVCVCVCVSVSERSERSVCLRTAPPLHRG